MVVLVDVTKKYSSVASEQIRLQWNRLRTAKDLQIRHQVEDQYIIPCQREGGFKGLISNILPACRSIEYRPVATVLENILVSYG